MFTYNVRNFKINTKEALDLVASGETVLLVRGGQIFKVEKYGTESKPASESLPRSGEAYDIPVGVTGDPIGKYGQTWSGDLPQASRKAVIGETIGARATKGLNE